MASLTVKVKDKSSNKLLLELNSNNFERLLADFGFFSSDFLKSIDKAEKDYKTGKVKKIKSLQELN